MSEPLRDSTYQKQLLALTGLFQAAGLVHTIAKGQYEDPDDFKTSIESLFVQCPDTSEACYPGLHLDTGNYYLKQFFGREYNPNIIQVCRYAFSLFKVYRQFKKQPELKKDLEQILLAADEKRAFFQDPLASNLIEFLADGYVQIFGSLSFRIQIIGKKIVLNDKARLAKMRCLLLAGIRSVVLWEQLGGSTWRLFLFRKRYLNAFEQMSVASGVTIGGQGTN